MSEVSRVMSEMNRATKKMASFMSERIRPHDEMSRSVMREDPIHP